MMKVQNLINARGNANANQFIITDNENNTTYFQSYDSLVCKVEKYPKMKITFGCDWDYSNTTMKHLYTFLADEWINLANGKDVRKAIKNGHCFSKNGTQFDVVYDENMR